MSNHDEVGPASARFLALQAKLKSVERLPEVMRREAFAWKKAALLHAGDGAARAAAATASAYEAAAIMIETALKEGT